MTIHFDRLSGQIGYISCEVVSFFFPLVTPILVAVCLAFRVEGNLHVLGTEDKIEVQDQEFYTWLFSKPVGKTGMWKTKNDVYEKCR